MFPAASSIWFPTVCALRVFNSHRMLGNAFGFVACVVQHHYDGRKALAKNFFMLMDSYQNHPEAKSLGSDGSRVLLTRVAYCNALTLLRTGLLSTSERNPTSTGKKAK